VAAAALISAAPAGCVRYQLGGSLPPGIRSVAVPVFINACGHPGVEAEATRATIEAFQRDGSLRVVGEAQADAVLEATLRRYDLQAVAYRETQRTTAREYRLTLAAEVVFRKRSDGTVLSAHKLIAGDATFDATTDLPTAQRRALPAAARDLASHIVRVLVEYW
jgi:hypothetical protein